MGIKAILGVSLLLCAGSIFAQNGGFNISGRVTDGDTNEPLMGVYVTTGKQGAQTNGEGIFVIKGVPSGRVRLSTMYYSSYSTVSKDIILSGDTSLVFSIAERAFAIDEVVVTGTRTEKRLSEVPVLTTVIREREMQKSGSVSTLEALQDNLPGIAISPNAMGNNMRIKGLNSRYILFLVDGERLVCEGAGGNVNLDQIDVNSIKKIEVINGAASALYGSNAVGAVINIITKEPAHRFEAGANVIAESHNTWKTKVDAGVNFDRVNARAGVFRSSSDGFGADGGGAYAAKYEDYGANLKLGYRLTERADVNVIGRYFRHETFNPVGSMNVAHALTNTLTVGANGGYRSRDERNVVRVSVNFDQFFDYDVLEKKGDELKNNNRTSYLSSRVVNTFSPTERWQVVGGVEHNHEENFSTKSFGELPTDKKLDDVNLFAQGEYEILKDFDVVVGARYTYNTQFKSAFTPKVSLMYGVGGFKFRGGVGSAFRTPSLKELYYDFDHQGMFWVYGNPDLEAEKGLYTSLSTEYTRGYFNASVSGYYNHIDSKITQYDVINAEGANEKYYKNVSSATLKGVDINVSCLFFSELAVKGSYSYCDARDNSTGLQLESNVKHSATVSATWNGKVARSPFSLQFAGRVNSPILYQQMVTDNGDNQVSELTESDAYSIWKAVLVKPFRMNKHTLELTLKCDNIFNFKEASFINPGRQYLVGVRYAFK